MELPPVPASSSERFWANFLSVFLGLYVFDAALEILNNGLYLTGWNSPIEGLLGFENVVFLLVALLIYSLLGLNPLLPKRYIVTLLLGQLAQSLVDIYLFTHHLDEILIHPGYVVPFSLVMAFGQALVGLGVIYWLQGGWRWQWPLFPVERLAKRTFRLVTLIQVSLVGLGLVVALFFYLAFCTSDGIERMSAGFIVLHWNRVGLRSKTYVRQDGKTVELMAMMHVGNTRYYQEIQQAIPAHGSVLLEGITDSKHLLQKRLDYTDIASKYNLASQREQFLLPTTKKRRADIDISDFSPATIQFLDAVARLLDLSDPDLSAWGDLQRSLETPHIGAIIQADVLDKRNQHLLGEMDKELQVADLVVIPWGAAHMPTISAAVVKEGFKLQETREFPVLYFFGAPHP